MFEFNGIRTIKLIKTIIAEIKNGNLFPKSKIKPAVNEPVTWPIALDEFKSPIREP